MTSLEFKKLRLKYLIKERAFKIGNFTLASGKQSNYYIDSKQILFYHESLALVTHIMNALGMEHHINIVAGLEIGAIPIITGIVLRAQKLDLEGIVVRKQAKDHGIQSRLVGRMPVNKPWKAFVVDDVWTTGESTMQAIVELKKENVDVVKVMSIVDRNEGSNELLSDYPRSSIFKIEEFF